MRIGLDARAIGPQLPGIGRATLGLLRGLVEIDHDHELTLLHQSVHRSLLEEVGAADDRRFHLLAADVSPFRFLAQGRVPRPEGLDVWHAPYFIRPLTGRPPVVVTVYDLIRPQRTTDVAKWAVKMRLSLKLAAHVIAVSNTTRDDVIRRIGIAPSAMTTVPLGVDPHFRACSPEEVKAVRSRYALPPRYVLYVGTNKPHKNVDALVAAMKTVPDAGLVLAGVTDSEHFLLRDVPDRDLPALYSGAICFASPSLHEGFNLPLLEAMACGTPVIASNRTSIPESVGDAGLLVEPTADALAEGLRRLLADDSLRADLRRRGLERVRRFTWKRTAQETLRVYETAARRD